MVETYCQADSFCVHLFMKLDHWPCSLTNTCKGCCWTRVITVITALGAWSMQHECDGGSESECGCGGDSVDIRSQEYVGDGGGGDEAESGQ